jgi:hypothetical protein
MRRWIGPVGLVVAVLLSGCTPPVSTPVSSPVSPSTTAAPAPTFLCTPEAGGAESPCSQARFEEMKRKDALYAEAEAVYRRVLAEDERFARGGGADSLSETYLATLGSERLRSETLEILRSDKADRRVMKGGEFRLTGVARLPASVVAESVVALRACVDLTTVSIYERGRLLGKGGAREEYVYFALYDGLLKISHMEYEEVSKC